MIFINMNTHKTMDECEDIISARVLRKYPFRHNVDDGFLGINWIKNTPKKIWLYYESGELNRFNERTTWKALFFGRLKRKNNDVYLQGIIMSEPIRSAIAIATLLFLCLGILFTDVFGEFDFVSFLVAFLFTYFFFISLSKEKREIKKYLTKIFLD